MFLEPARIKDLIMISSWQESNLINIAASYRNEFDGGTILDWVSKEENGRTKKKEIWTGLKLNQEKCQEVSREHIIVKILS